MKIVLYSLKLKVSIFWMFFNSLGLLNVINNGTSFTVILNGYIYSLYPQTLVHNSMPLFIVLTVYKDAIKKSKIYCLYIVSTLIWRFNIKLYLWLQILMLCKTFFLFLLIDSTNWNVLNRYVFLQDWYRVYKRCIRRRKKAL